MAIDHIISLMKEKKFAEVLKAIQRLDTYLSHDESFQIIQLVFENDQLDFYLSLENLNDWGQKVRGLPLEDSIKLIGLLPENSRIAGYLLFKAIKTITSYNVQQDIGLRLAFFIEANEKIVLELAKKILNTNIHESEYEEPLFSVLLGQTQFPWFEKIYSQLRTQQISYKEKNIYDATPVHRAASVGKLSYLMPNFNDANSQDLWGNTPLHYAIKAEKLDSVKLLIEGWKADINLANTAGMTPLMLAIAMGQVEIVKYLLEHEANPNLADEFGATAIDWAHGLGRAEIAELLSQYTDQKPKEEAVIQALLVKAAYVASLSDVGNMGRDSNVLLSAFKDENRHMFVVNSEQDLFLLLTLIKAEAEKSPADFSAAIQINDVMSSHFSAAHLQIVDGKVSSLIVDTIPEGIGIKDYADKFQIVFPAGLLIISKTAPQKSINTCRVFAQEIAEKMGKYGVDYDDLSKHLDEEGRLKEEALPLVLGGRTVESVSLLKQIQTYRTAANPKEKRTNKRGDFVDIVNKEIYGASKPKNQFFKNKLKRKYLKAIKELKSKEMSAIQENMQRRFGFFMLPSYSDRFNMQPTMENGKITIMLGGFYSYDMKQLVEINVSKLQAEFANDSIRLGEKEMPVSGAEGMAEIVTTLVATPQALERLIAALKKDIEEIHYLTKNEILTGKKHDVKSAPLMMEAFVRDLEKACEQMQAQASPKLD